MPLNSKHFLVTEMTPIKLTRYDDFLNDYPGSDNKDNSKLSYCIGVHDTCFGFIDLLDSSQTYNVIYCRKCHLRIPIPRNIVTYGELSQWLEFNR